MIKKKQTLYIGILFIICNLLVIGILYLNEGWIKKVNLDEYASYTHLNSQSTDIKGNIEYVNIDDYYEIIGWILNVESPITIYNCHTALEDTQKNYVYILPTKMTVRTDVGELYNDAESNFDKCGYHSKALRQFLPFDNNTLEIVIIYNNNGDKIYYHTNKFITNATYRE